MTKNELISFETEIAKLYEEGKIKAPIHLGGGNEDELIELFQVIKPTDWIFSTWRNHLHWLLSGRSPSDLRQQIVDGHSMHVFGNRFFTSAIVGGIAPIAVGTAYALQRSGQKDRVWCFLGDMGASTGVAMESIRYACGHALPITFVIEDNGLSVKTDTASAWGCEGCLQKDKNHRGIPSCDLYDTKVIKHYTYDRQYPHAGTGVFVLF